MLNTITNEKAADEARRLAKDLVEVTLKAASRLPEGTSTAELLEAVGLRLVPQQKSIEGPFQISGHPETIELAAELPDALPEHAVAVRQLTRVRTEDLRGLTSGEVAERRRRVRSELTDRCEQLRKPLGRFTVLVPGAKSRRSALEADRLNQVRAILSRQPLPSQIFKQVSGSVLNSAGLTEAQLSTLGKLATEAEQLHRDLLHRGETIQAWAADAVAEDTGGIELDLSDTEASRARLRTRKAVAAQRRDAELAQRLAEKVEQKHKDASETKARQEQLENDRQEKAARSREASLRAFKARRKMENLAAEPEHDSSPEFSF